ncbi:formin-like protein 18 [Cinnamomum micranthum f. kanehirae]|uniref:Formin-like protein n=1 Tax=Cinnamomum micranthum f. kanehirae TaxID=337451 RepID=A0A443PK37_9MAGN|nr:formin-like protein 18 [Cinnamomum micranthum f. kanehirae]
MSLFRKFFYRKPPDGLLEISERIFVFDCCFSTDALGEDNYKVYIGDILHQLREHFPEAIFMVFNFKEGERQGQISEICSEYDMTVMDYPRHYEGCPLLSMEMIHHFLRSSDSWLLLGQNNMLLMHCERGGWPVLAFILAGLLIFRKQYAGEQKTLEMIHKQAPRELLQLLSPLNPLPSQLRYLQYISRRNAGPGWPPLDRPLTLDCIILRAIPNFDGEGGCRPIFRIYGKDPFVADNQISKVLFSTPKKGRTVQLFRQADCELVKIDIRCHVQGDVVLECISLDEDLEREEMMFRVMFNTAFIRSNILMLNRDEIDILWNNNDQFPKEFRAEVLFSEMDAATSVITLDVAGIEEREGLPIEAFAKVHEMFSSADWLGTKGEVSLNMLQQITGKLETASPQATEISTSLLESNPNTPRGKSMPASETIIMKSSTLTMKKQITTSHEPSPESYPTTVQPQEKLDAVKKQTTPSLEPSAALDPIKQNVQLQEVLGALTNSAQAKITSQQITPTSLSIPASDNDSFPGSSLPMETCHSEPSTAGVTALLHDHAASRIMEVTLRLTSSSPSTAVEPCLAEPAKTSTVSSPLPTVGDSTIRSPPAPPPLSPPMLSHSPSAPKQSPPAPPPPPPPPLHPGMSSLVRGSSMSAPPPPLRESISFSGSTIINDSSNPPAPPPPPPPPPPISAPSPPPPPPPLCCGPLFGPATGNLPPPPPLPPGLASQDLSLASPAPPPIPPATHALLAHGLSKSALGKKGRVMTRSASPKKPLSVHSTSKRASLKPLHWVKVTRAMQGSLWAEAQKNDEAVKYENFPYLMIEMAPEIDISELETLFSVAVPNSDTRKPGEKSSRRASLGSKPEKVQLIDLRRAYNCEIMLTKVKIPIPDLLSSVLALDDSVLDVDQVENLIKFCPTKEEMELLKVELGCQVQFSSCILFTGYGGDKENLGKCEQFFLELMKVPRVESKLRVFSFKIQFKPQVSDLRNSLNIVNSTGEEIRKSVKLKRIMQTILSLGNALNQGTSRGSAIGFRLDSLLKLTDTRARNNKMTLMHYLCKVKLYFFE